MTSQTDERVLVIPAIFAGDVRKGFCTLEKSRKLAAELIKSDQLRFMPRSEVEDDPRFLQLIPYVILYRYQPNQWFGSQCQVFNYRRGSAGGESRLVGKRSIGIGGHINDSDGIIPQDAFHAGVLREINEEVSCIFNPVGSLIGTIYDDSDAVGRVHLGIVISFRLTGFLPVIRDKSLIDPSIYSIDTLVDEKDDFENWSKLIIDGVLNDRIYSTKPFITDYYFALATDYSPNAIKENIQVASNFEKIIKALKELQNWIDDERDDARAGEGSFANQDPAIVRGKVLKEVSQKIDELKTKVGKFSDV